MMLAMRPIACDLRRAVARVAALASIALVAVGCSSDENGSDPSKSGPATKAGVVAAPCDLNVRAQRSVVHLEKAGFEVLHVSYDEPGDPKASLGLVLGELDGGVETTVFVFCDANAASKATKLAELVAPGEVVTAVARQATVVLTKVPEGEEREQTASRIRDEVFEALRG